MCVSKPDIFSSSAPLLSKLLKTHQWASLHGLSLPTRGGNLKFSQKCSSELESEWQLVWKINLRFKVNLWKCILSLAIYLRRFASGCSCPFDRACPAAPDVASYAFIYGWRGVLRGFFCEQMMSPVLTERQFFQKRGLNAFLLPARVCESLHVTFFFEDCMFLCQL